MWGSFSYQKMVKTTFVNAKRVILPILSLTFLFFVGFLLVSLVLRVVYPTKFEATTAFQTFLSSLRGWNFVSLVFEVVGSFLVFAPIFFSIENLGFFQSLKKSIVFSLRNVRFLLPIMVYMVAQYTISMFFKTNNGWEKYLGIGIVVYINLILSGSALLYYQENRQSS